MFNISFFQIVIVICLIFILFGDFSRFKKNVILLKKKIYKKQEE